MESERLTVSLVKMDNGYQIALVEPLKVEPPKTDAESIDDQFDAEMKLDALIDGIIAFTRHLHDRSAGEDWKDEDRGKIREGFRALFPSVSRVIGGGPPMFGVAPGPRVEQMVFQKKSDLLAYLDKNL